MKANGACIHETRLKQTEHYFWQVHLDSPGCSPGAQGRGSALKHIQSFCERGLFVYFKASPYGAGIHFNIHLVVYWNTLQRRKLAGTNFALSLCLGPDLWYLPGRHLCTCVVPHHFCGYCQGTALDYLVLVASRAYVHRSHKNAINRERATPHGTAVETQQTETPSLGKRGLLASLHSCNLRGRLLVKHTSRDQL